MFGLTEEEMNLYRDAIDEFSSYELTNQIINNSLYIAPLLEQNGEYVPDILYIRELVMDIKSILIVTAINIAYDYASLLDENCKTEAEIIQYLHGKYEDYVVSQFINKAIVFTSDIILEIIGTIILELPYIYVYSQLSDNFDEATFLEEKLEAYSNYLQNTISKLGEEGEE